MNIIRINYLYLHVQYIGNMDVKLTLKLDQDIIEQAKNYAKMKNTSLSQLIEGYVCPMV